ncbi:tetratricopeptide repeat protein [Psychroserpens sp. S379A]|uniref:tetratricopeptide repeat protein n=1 Tax=Psychroserpens sp. S379A TaxID=3415137 RepID=UPI003C7A6668
MKTIKTVSIYLILVLTYSVYAQDMNEGFQYLENGNYQKATVFFKNILQEHPENKTAQICYGRAIGLNDKPAEALELFSELLNTYPNDFEVKLNYAEALLWNSKFKDAKTFYHSLVSENANNFSALLGYANTLSNLKEYEQALVYVDRALVVSPNNPGAMVSKKYIYLGHAYQEQQLQNYKISEVLLQTNLELFPKDKTILLNLANLYFIWDKIDKAEVVLHVLGENPDHTLESLNGLALASHLKGNDKEALQLSTESFKTLSNQTETQLRNHTTERHIQALIWNGKYKNAEILINDLLETHQNENWVLALRATLHVYKSQFKKSLLDYNTILENDSTSFDGNLGKANNLKALGRFNEAYEAAEKTLQIYNNQKDALAFINQLNATFTPSIETRAAYTFDNGDNSAYYVNTTINVPFSTNLQVFGNYNFRSTENSVTNNSASSNDFSLGVSYQLIPQIIFKGSAGLTDAQTQENNYTQFLTKLSLQFKPFRLQSTELGYHREIQTFNADLLEREILQNHFYLNHNLSTNFNLGWFTQLMYTTQNDGNQRTLLFTSLYYNLLKKPALKVGFNYQHIGFKDQLPAIYFSPKHFNAGEIFVNLIKDENTSKPKSWFYELTAATGKQFINSYTGQTTYRFQGKLGYKLSQRSLINVYGLHSNIASATAAGFTFTEVGIRFKWLVFEKPLFKN